ncbi:hypothetical protein [Thermostaphylospora chromogena]|uniref:Uncharacterized protein n=1 Tax=Thermostaphylospora chromogena TaxID=35622 RepID=A0A1H1HZ55_9ACTN|nr:hypothetical protein [Thermostaphylospora chromogena]SDR30737.1 hypothetical protein SAMN04489764_4991 [Thermostaphylospora chromogena]
MPSPIHDTLNVLFRDRPEFAVELLRDQLGIKLPDAPVQVAAGEFNDRPSRDLRADTVLILGRRDEPEHGLIIEIQQKIEDSKRDTLARYAAALWLQLRCPVTVMVVCPQIRVAAWAAEPVATNLDHYVLTPAVVGPEQIPVITDPAQARAHPELAALSLMAHGKHRPVVEAFAEGLTTLEDRHAPQYYEYGYRLASLAARRILEEIMASTTWPVYSPFAREHYGRGREAGREEGREEGKAIGEAMAVLAVLDARGIEVHDDARARITSCTDLVQLERWVRRAVTVSQVDELFADA